MSKLWNVALFHCVWTRITANILSNGSYQFVLFFCAWGEWKFQARKWKWRYQKLVCYRHLTVVKSLESHLMLAFPFALSNIRFCGFWVRGSVMTRIHQWHFTQMTRSARISNRMTWKWHCECGKKAVDCYYYTNKCQAQTEWRISAVWAVNVVQIMANMEIHTQKRASKFEHFSLSISNWSTDHLIWAHSHFHSWKIIISNFTL